MKARGVAAAVFLSAIALPLPAHDVQPLPPPGTYQLPSIQRAPDGEVVDASGYLRTLGEFTTGRITLMGLVYTRCADPEGCPRAMRTFADVRSLLRTDPTLQKRVRLVTLSFDPLHDDFASLGAYAESVGRVRGGADWHFLTTRSQRALAPILEGFGQDVRPAIDAAGADARLLAHSLKVFLIDAEGLVREIYSAGYLEPRMIVNDMRTLAAERRPSHARR